jgi:hypothetical protein
VAAKGSQREDALLRKPDSIRLVGSHIDFNGWRSPVRGNMLYDSLTICQAQPNGRLAPMEIESFLIDWKVAQSGQVIWPDDARTGLQRIHVALQPPQASQISRIRVQCSTIFANAVSPSPRSIASRMSL